MKRADKKETVITEQEISLGSFSGINTYDPHSKLSAEQFRGLTNVDIFGSYLKTRRGSQALSEYVNPALPGTIQSKVYFDAGSSEYFVMQGFGLPFQYIRLNSGGGWKSVMEWNGTTPWNPYYSEPCDLVVSNGKIYAFNPEGNAIIEYDQGAKIFKKRKIGLPAPQIVEIRTSGSPPGGGLVGKRIYGVELVYKDTTVTPNVDIIVSGPNRALMLSNPQFTEGRLAYSEHAAALVKVSGTLNDGTSITATENGFWTHARLYRTKDLTSETTGLEVNDGGEAEIVGRETELFQVQEMTRSAFLGSEVMGYYYFNVDSVADDDIPFPLDVITGDRLELVPVPPATVGAFHRDRIWVSGVVSVPGPAGNYILPSLRSKILFTPESKTKYSESLNVLNAIESDPGDGEQMKRLISFQEDLIGIKEGKTGRIKYGDPNSGWITEDQVIGIENKNMAQFVPNVGICAIVNDQNDFRIFGYDMVWHSSFSGMQISKPIRNYTKDIKPNEVNFMYLNGKLFVTVSGGLIMVLHVEQQLGWTTYKYSPDSIEALFSYGESRRAVIFVGGHKPLRIEVDDLDTDYDIYQEDTQNVPYEIITPKFQDVGGRSIIEQRFLSVVAKISTKMTAQPYVNGKLWDVPFDLILDPGDYPDSNLQETEYQGYSQIKPLGNYLHYRITGLGPASIHSILLNCLIQRGSIRPGFDPFSILSLASTLPSWLTSAEYVETGTADIEIIENGVQTTEIVEDD